MRWDPSYPSVLAPKASAREPRAASGGFASQLNKGVVVAANRTRVIELVEHVARRAQEMLEAKAFLHWYEQFGTQRGDVARAVECLWDISDSYRACHGLPSTS